MLFISQCNFICIIQDPEATAAVAAAPPAMAADNPNLPHCPICLENLTEVDYLI